MEAISLYTMIKYIQNGTNLHIGVLFFGSYGNEMCKLPHNHLIHNAPLCESIKGRSKDSYKRCFRCRNLALRKALSSKAPFGGICINGIYEYTHPVVIRGEVACVIFIGNILPSDGHAKISQNTADTPQLLDTMEKKLTHSDIVTISKLLENHILFLLEKFSNESRGVNPLIENLKNYIRSNLEFDIDIGHIAEQFHYNKTYLGRLFKKETGMCIKDYICFHRIEKAKMLLESTNDAVIDIAGKSGFNTVTYFNRVFKAVTNTTPLEYRKMKNSAKSKER